MLKAKYFVYLLQSEISNRTYVGYTVNIERRLKQHNGLLSGGAKKTRKYRPWKLILFVSGFEFEKTALQYEFRIQHPPKIFRRKGVGIPNKIRIMKFLLQSDKICSTAPLNSELSLIIYFLKENYHNLWNST